MTDTSGSFDLSSTVAAANGKDPLAGLRGLVQQDQKILDAKAKDPTVTKDQQAVADATVKGSKDVHAAYDGIEKLGDRIKPWDAEKEMSERQTNPLQSFGSFGAIFALAASAFTRTPAINAMNGMTAAVNAVKANDEDKYKKAYEAWKENYQLALERHKAQHEDYEDAMSMADHDINGAKAKLLADSVKYDDAHTRTALEMGDLEKLSSIQNARDASARGWIGIKPEIEAFHEHMDTMFSAQKELLPAYLKTPAGQQFLAQNPKFDPNNPDMKKMPKDFIGAAALLTTQKEAQAKRAGGLTSMSAQEAQAVEDKVANGVPREDAIAQVAKASKGLQVDMTDPNMASNIKAVANYKMAPPSNGRNPAYRTEFMDQVLKANPNYDDTKYAEKSKAVKDFGTGKQGDIARSLGVGIAHLGTLEELADALDNGDVKRFNAVANRWAEETGQPAPSNFDAAKVIVGDEVVKSIVGGQNAQSDREASQKAFENAKSPAILKGAIATVKKLMGGQVRGLESQYRRTTGATDFYDTFLNDEARKELGISDAPQPGTIEGGHRFKGGDPADPNSWEAVQ